MMTNAGSDAAARPLRSALLCSTAVAVATLFLATGPTAAQTWDSGAGTSSWATNNNWDPNGVPTAADTVTIDNGALANQPRIFSGQSFNAAQTNISAGSLTITAGGSLTSPVAVSGTGRLVMQATGELVGDVTTSATVNTAGLIDGTLTVTGGVTTNIGRVTGATTVSGGALTLNAGSNLANAQALTVNGGTVNVNGSDSVGNLAGTGGRVDIDAGQILTAGGNNAATSSYGGVLTGAGTLNKAGSGNLELTGNSTNTGPIDVSAGTLTFSGAGATDSTDIDVATTANLNSDGGAFATSTAISLAGTADLALTGDESIARLDTSAASGVDLNGARLTLNSGASAMAGVISGSGGVTNAGTSAAVMTANNTYTGATRVTGGSLAITGAGKVASPEVAVSGGTLITDSDALTAAVTVAVSGSGTFTSSGSDSYTGITQSGGTINGSGVQNLTGGFVQSGGTTAGTVDINAATFTQTGGMVGAGTTVTSTGAQSLQGGNIRGSLDGAGAVTVSTGTTYLSVDGTIAATAVSIAADGRLISDGGGLAAGAAVTNAGALTLTSAGDESVASVNGAGAIVLSSGSVLTVNSGASAIAGVVSGSGGLTVAGGTTTLSAANTFIGPTTVNSGATLVLSGGAAIADRGAVVVDGGTLNVGATETIGSLAGSGGTVQMTGNLTAGSNNSSTDFAGALTGTGGFTKTGTGTMTLSGASTATSTTTVMAGRLNVTGSVASAVLALRGTGELQVDGASLADTAAVTLGETAKLIQSGSETIGSLASAAAGTSVDLGAGTLTVGDATNTGFAGVISGTGGLTKQGAGQLTLSNANTYTGTTTATAGVLAVTGGGSLASTDLRTSGSGGITTDGGALAVAANILNIGTGGLIITGGSETVASVNGAGAIGLNTGALTLTSGASVISGPVSGSGALNVNGGAVTLSGAKTNTGAVNLQSGSLALTGSIGGALNAAAGSALTVAGGTVAGVTTNNSATAFNIAGGTFAGGLVNASGQITAGGAITGNIANASGAVFDIATGGLTGNGGNAFANSGTLNVTSGNAAGLGALTNTGSGVINVAAGRSLAAVTLANAAGGAVRMSSGAVGGDFTNAGTLAVSGSSAVNGAFVNSGVTDMANGVTGDVLTVSGAASGNGLYQMDINLTTGASDQLVGNGGVTGAINLDFDVIPGTGGITIAPVTVVTGVSDTATFAQQGLPKGGGIKYALQRDADGNLNVTSDVNLGFSGVASSVALTQSMLNSVVNRPTSPLTGAIADEGAACSQGGYGQITAGNGTVTGTAHTRGGSYDTEMTMNFSGIQGGYDYGCYDGRFFNGWDGALGIMVGVNTGNTEQGVFSDPINVALQTSDVKTDFTQNYGGIYIAGAKDRLSIDLQFNVAQNTFDLSENLTSGIVDPTYLVGLDGLSFSTNTTAFSGRLNYRLDVDAERLISFIPTIGFNYFSTTGDTLTLASGETLEIIPYDTTVAFLGGSLAKSTVNPDGTSAITYYVSGTYYQDLGGERNAVYSPAGSSGPAPVDIGIDSIGSYGDVSVGMSYLKLLKNGPVGARQLNAGIWADTRFGETVSDSYSLTAQIRFSF